jgi:glycosyltransferase involved in cell wall biosynthesis
MVLIDSIYINKSGGKILLEYLFNYIIKNNINDRYYFLFDERIKGDISYVTTSIKFSFLKPSESQRKRFYNENMYLFDSVFCFANVPPPILIKNKKVTIYFHNVLLASFSHANLSYFETLKYRLKYFYIKFKNDSNYLWIVQTSKIGDLINKEFGIRKSNILEVPFFNVYLFNNCNKSTEKGFNNYLYIADSSSQKNHLRLLNAWYTFTNDKKFQNLTLNLTLSESSSKVLLDKIEYLKNMGCNIINHNDCTAIEIKELFKNCNYLIFPSLAESFGLPLLEAASAGCKIIASNLPYVFNVIEPSLVFNPYEESSIISALIKSRDYKNIKDSKLIVEDKIDHLLNII